MESNLARYEIIDEPAVKSWGERLIVDPTIILFAAFLVPLLWQPPLAGRFWIPLVWLIVNGYALGSSTLGKEIATLAVGALCWLALLFSVSFLLKNGGLPLAAEEVYPYLRIFLFGIFFLTLYLVVFRQAKSYQLYKYIRGDEE